MRFNIVSNITNGAGLQRDYLLLKSFLEARGHQVTGVMFNEHPAPPSDVSIFLEVVNPALLGKENWLIPNTEWWYEKDWDRFLPRFSKVLCKTRDAERFWQQKTPGKAQFVGFEALDFYDPAIPRKPAFLHMAGKSETKNTAAVMEAWREFNLPYPLTVVAWKPNIARLCKGQNVTHFMRVEESEMPRMVNEHLFHIMPSRQEGFGHMIHEAIGCGGVVLTTGAPPMNEFNGVARELLIPAEGSFQMRAATAHNVTAQAVAEAVERAVRLSRERIAEISSAARAAFLADREEFRQAFGALC